MKYVKAQIQNEQGNIGFGTIILLLILVTSIYDAIQIIRIYNKHWTFEEEVNEFVRFAFTDLNGESHQQITERIIEMLDEMGAQYNKKHVKVNVDENEGKITVEVWYSQSVNVPFPPNPKQFYIYIQSTD